MYMYNLICITNRHLCSNNFLEQIEKICRDYSSKARDAGIGQKSEFIHENVGEVETYQVSAYSNENSGEVGHATECSNEGEVQAETREFAGCSNKYEGQARTEQISGRSNEHEELAGQVCKCSEQNTVEATSDNLKIVLREKDLQESEYEQLAKQVLEICSKYNIECILHTYYNVAEKLNCKKIHLPLDILRKNPGIAEKFEVIGVSTHSEEEAIEAQTLGASYITAGHIFETDCKKGLPGRGLKFLKKVCESVKIPVYAIGGISSANINKVIEAGAYGACLMSGFMKAENVQEFFR